MILLKLKRLKYLQQLALDGYIILLSEVLDELLSDGRAAEGILHADEHIDKCTCRSIPVNTVMTVKAFVLDGNKSLLHIFGDLVIIDPDTVLLTVKGRKLLPFTFRVLIIDGTRLIKCVIAKVKLRRRNDAGLDVEGKNAQEQKTGQNADQKNRSDNKPGIAVFTGLFFFHLAATPP